MCGRYAQPEDLSAIAAAFDAADVNEGQWNWQPSYNIAPSAVVPVIALNGQGTRALVPMRWGLHPHWSKAMPEGRPLFNARVETASEKPSFRTPFKRRRALIPYRGWFEWEGVERPKQPYFIEPKNSEISVLAGLWDQYRVDEGITLLSMTILTTPATGRLRRLHHRMPVRLSSSDWAAWLDPNERPEPILARKLDDEDLRFFPVSRAVNNGRAQGAELIEPDDSV